MEKKAHFNYGKRKDIALVFSCPGQEEENDLRPVSGSTGDNLELLLLNLKKEGLLTSFESRYDFRITNASVNVHYKEKTNRSEELDSILFQSSNLLRLYNELNDIERYIICFGKKATRTVEKMLLRHSFSKTGCRVIYTKHLGLKSLNQIEIKDNCTTPTKIRLQLLAKEITNCL
jgi:hypothetical protein